jgi:pimeloyl-ACP methyl ester carboxylesterase
MTTTAASNTEMAKHALGFVDALRLPACDLLGYSLGGMVALQMAQDRP